MVPANSAPRGNDSRSLAKQITISPSGFLQSLVRGWRIEDRIGDLPLALERETNDFSLLRGLRDGDEMRGSAPPHESTVRQFVVNVN